MGVPVENGRQGYPGGTEASRIGRWYSRAGLLALLGQAIQETNWFTHRKRKLAGILMLILLAIAGVIMRRTSSGRDRRT